MPGFRSLENGERVQFSLRPRQVRPKESEPKEGHEAYFVTAEVDGESLKVSESFHSRFFWLLQLSSRIDLW